MFCPLLTSSSSAGHSWSWFWWCNLNCSPSDVCWKGTDWYELFLGQILVLSHRAGRGSETHLQLGTAFFFLRYIHFARSLFQHNVGFIFLFSSKYSNKISYREHAHESTRVNTSQHESWQMSTWTDWKGSWVCSDWGWWVDVTDLMFPSERWKLYGCGYFQVSIKLIFTWRMSSGTVEEWKSVWTGSDFDLSVLKRAAGREVMFLFIVPQSVQVFWTLLSVRITINLN